jgi:hypothetical protein
MRSGTMMAEIRPGDTVYLTTSNGEVLRGTYHGDLYKSGTAMFMGVTVEEDPGWITWVRYDRIVEMSSTREHECAQ